MKATTTEKRSCKKMKLNTPITLAATDAIRFPVEKNQTYRVYSFIDREGRYTSSVGWLYSKAVHPDGQNHGPAGMETGFWYDKNSVCPSATLGQLIGVWLPKTNLIEKYLDNLDLLEKTLPVGEIRGGKPDNVSLTNLLETVFAQSFPVGVTEDQVKGDDCWMGIAPYTGWLVLLQNDVPVGYTDNEGAIVVNARGIEPSFEPFMGMEEVTDAQASSGRVPPAARK